jgi:hypothetical protein
MQLLPNAASLISQALRATPEVAALIGDRVYTEIPKDPTWPLIRVTRFGGVPVTTTPLWLDEARIQIDCWGGTKWQAWQAAETARAALTTLPGVHTVAGQRAVVTGITLGSFAEDADPSYTPARPRCRFDVTVHLHP